MCCTTKEFKEPVNTTKQASEGYPAINNSTKSVRICGFENVPGLIKQIVKQNWPKLWL